MHITSANYHRLAKFVGLLLTLMGVCLITIFVAFMWTGVSPLVDATPSIDGIGLLVLASLGAFALPLGVSLFNTDSATSARLKIAAYALGLMAVLRLVAFVSADLRAVVGVTPLIEFFVLGATAFAAFFVRPSDESPIQIRTDVALDVSATEAWRVLAGEFGDVAAYARGVQSSSLAGVGDVGEGTVRTCRVAGVRPRSTATITETMVAFDPDGMRYAYVAGGQLPRMIAAATNRWSVHARGPSRCRAHSHVSVELRWWALPLAPLLGWGIRSELLRFGEDLKHRLEHGAVSSRKRVSRQQR